MTTAIPAPAIRTTRPSATLSLEPTGSRSLTPRQHSLKVTLRLNRSDTRFADQSQVANVVRRVLAILPPTDGAINERTFGDVRETSAGRKSGGVSVVVALEGSVTCPDRPADVIVESLREALLSEGYQVLVRERLECAELGCKTDVIIDWGQAAQVPRNWYSNRVCGGHNYRTCRRCGSIFAMSCTNAVGPAPSVHCEVCGLVLVEWGSSKIWSAELVTRAVT
jgi:hypothetical protein